MADKNPIMEGGPTFLVKYSNKGMDEDIPKRIPFLDFLTKEGFKRTLGHGVYAGCYWVWVNINSKSYANGMPGICMAPYIGPHAITVGEFMTIYNIYKKYKGKEKPFK